MKNATRLAGRTLAQIANERSVSVPHDQKRAKGWIGKLMELSLGATAATLPEPDLRKYPRGESFTRTVTV